MLVEIYIITRHHNRRGAEIHLAISTLHAGLKSHDCHVIMTQLLPIALRGLLSENVRVPIVKLCAFLNAISPKVINQESLTRLQKDVVQCLVSFELVFPPSFFNIMTHLLVHLVDEIAILGPVFLHNMFPF